MDRLYVDVETLPTDDADIKTWLTDLLEAPSNYRDREKIDAYIAKKETEVIRSTALNPLWGQLFCVGWAWNEDPVNTFVKTGELEDGFIAILWEEIRDTRPGPANRAVTWAGFNVGFDLRFLRLRSIINNVKPSVYVPVNEPSWSQAIIDAQELIGGRDLKYVSLDDAAVAFGLPTKQVDVDELWAAYADGYHEKVREYCAQDVEVTRELIQRLEPQQKLDYMGPDNL